MSINRVKHILSKGEGIRIEYKKSRTALPRNVFESVCAMLNRNGGHIILGADDYGTITGVDTNHLEQIKTNLVNLSNNPEKLNPPYILFPQSYIIDGEHVIHIQIPSSSQVHKSANVIYDRSNDGDFRVAEPHQIAELYNSKRTHYTEGTIYEKVVFDDFKPELFPLIRNLIKSNKANHPWLALTDEQLLQKAGLWKKDYTSGKEGYTLAAILLFGKDNLIQHILPHYKIDALVRIQNTDRYDDRLYIQTNLIDAYKLLTEFAEKHLPDKFYTEGNQRKSLRAIIFREIIANILVHREYTNAHPATFIIYNDRVETENANNPQGKGLLDIATFSAYPKNPLLAKFFIELGWVDQLGSGVLNVNKFIKEYAGNESNTPQFVEDTIFKTVIPTPIIGGALSGSTTGSTIVTGTLVDGNDGAIDGAIDGVSSVNKNKLAKLLKAILQEEGKRMPIYKEVTGLGSDRTMERLIQQLRDASLIEFKGESPQTGGYFLTEQAKKNINKN